MDLTNDTAIRIRQSTHDLFMQYGLKSVSMDDIAAKMGISKKTIYQFYSDKEQLVAEVVTAIIKHNQQTCDIDRSRSDNAVHGIFLSMEQMSLLFHAMNPSILFDLYKYYPQSFKIFEAHKNDYLYGVIKENIIRGIGETLYRPEIKIDIMARFRVESIIVPFKPEFQSSVKSNLATIAEELATHFLFGIVTEKGYKLILKYLKENAKK